MAEALSHRQERWHINRIILLTWWFIYFLGIGIATRWGPGFTTDSLRALGQALLITALFVFFLRLIATPLLGFKRTERGTGRDQDNQLNMLWGMRWLVLIILSLGFLASTAGGMMSILIMRNPLPLVIPPMLILLKSPVINYLFPAVSR